MLEVTPEQCPCNRIVVESLIIPVEVSKDLQSRPTMQPCDELGTSTLCTDVLNREADKFLLNEFVARRIKSFGTNCVCLHTTMITMIQKQRSCPVIPPPDLSPAQPVFSMLLFPSLLLVLMQMM